MKPEEYKCIMEKFSRLETRLASIETALAVFKARVYTIGAMIAAAVSFAARILWR